MKFLLDSNILIYHFNNEKLATDFITKNIKQCAISQITYIEVLSFSFTEEEEKQVKSFLEKFMIIDINSTVAKQSVENRKLKKIKMADNIIASTAQVNDLILVTRNVDDFKALDIEIMNIFTT